MRRLAFTNKKVRGVPRRLRSLKKWSESFIGWFPDDLEPSNNYCTWRIPVLSSLVEGKQAQQSVQAECAQRLIDACAHLIKAKPEEASSFRVTCRVVLPAMFDSRVCIYLNEEAFQAHASEGGNEYGTTKPIAGRSLAKEWGLFLPEGVHEIGFHESYASQEDEWFVEGESWFFGEVLPANNSFKADSKPLRGSERP